MAANEFIGVDGSGAHGQIYDCPSPDLEDAGCNQYQGRFIMMSLAVPADWIWTPIVVAASFAVAFFVGAGLILSCWKVETDINPAPKAARDRFPVGPIETGPDRERLRRVTIDLHRYGLEVGVRHLLGGNRKTTILNPVTATFEAGKINDIMGSSGSGKT